MFAAEISDVRDEQLANIVKKNRANTDAMTFIFMNKSLLSTGIVVNGACTGVALPNTPKYKCHGIAQHDGACSGSVQRVY